MNLSATLTSKIDRLPPCMLRLFAKKDGRWATDKELMLWTGWGRKKLIGVFHQKSFANATAAEIDTAYYVCGVSWSSQRRQRWVLQCAYERDGMRGIASMRHLKPKTAWQAKNIKQYLTLVEELMTK